MYTVYATFEKEDINYVTNGLSLEEARNWYCDIVNYFYKRAGVTWQNNIALFENEDKEDLWRVEGWDSDGNPFHAGYYPEED